MLTSVSICISATTSAILGKKVHHNLLCFKRAPALAWAANKTCGLGKAMKGLWSHTIVALTIKAVVVVMKRLASAWAAREACGLGKAICKGSGPTSSWL